VELLPKYGIEKVVCLGDVVGYNTNPLECLKIIKSFNELEIIRGNHDRAVSFKDYKDFSSHAKQAVLWTIKNINETSLAYLRNLAQGPRIIDGEFVICHGSLNDEDDYILSNMQAKREFQWMIKNDMKLGFFGHTHYQINYSFNPVEKKITVLTDNRILLKKKTMYLINPGSIGQPRDKDNRGSFAVYDSEIGSVEIVRYSYDYETTAKKIKLHGLPAFLGERLSSGV
jgi:predicted phosphodiesterase